MKLKNESILHKSNSNTTMGLGQWLLFTGIQQIRSDLNGIDILFVEQYSAIRLLKIIIASLTNSLESVLIRILE